MCVHRTTLLYCILMRGDQCLEKVLGLQKAFPDQFWYLKKKKLNFLQRNSPCYRKIPLLYSWASVLPINCTLLSINAQRLTVYFPSKVRTWDEVNGPAVLTKKRGFLIQMRNICVLGHVERLNQQSSLFVLFYFLHALHFGLVSFAVC